MLILGVLLLCGFLSLYHIIGLFSRQQKILFPAKKELTFPRSDYIMEHGQNILFQIRRCTKWLKGPHSKCGRSGNRREGSNPSISAFLPIYDRKNFIYILLYKKHSHLLTIVYFICIIATVMKTQFNIGDWSNGMIGVSKTFGGSSILSSPAP